jgi:Leucine-rich repeat (LRR) protein
MPLTQLALNNNPITDLGALRRLKLEHLELVGTQVADLAPLKGMPLKFIDLRDCKQLKDAAPLAEMPTLVDVLLPTQVTGVDSLRKLPNLIHLSFNLGPGREPFACTAAEFWKTWDGLPWARKMEAAGIDFSYEQLHEGYYSVTVHDRKFVDCSIFKGSSVHRLDLGGSGVVDLTSLADLPLQALDIRGTNVTDLSPLGSPVLRDALRDIHLSTSNVANFDPIADCRNLETFDASGTALADLSVVKGMKLRTLMVGRTAVNDISVVAGMPLEAVDLGDTNVTDISPLLACATLRRVVLPQGAVAVGSLHNLSKLERISYTAYRNGDPDKTADQFWASNKEEPWMAALRKTSLTYKTRVLRDGTWELILDHQPISDLSILQGAKTITRLSMADAPVSDLSPLRGMPLTFLRISSTKVTDLSPIKGMPVTNLTMTATAVHDLTPLVGMPLHGLYMGDCKQIRDLSPLADMTTLDSITLPPGAKDIDFLRKFPNLGRIGYKSDKTTMLTAEQFWADYDRAATTRPARDETTQP